MRRGKKIHNMMKYWGCNMIRLEQLLRGGPFIGSLASVARAALEFKPPVTQESTDFNNRLTSLNNNKVPDNSMLGVFIHLCKSGLSDKLAFEYTRMILNDQGPEMFTEDMMEFLLDGDSIMLEDGVLTSELVREVVEWIPGREAPPCDLATLYLEFMFRKVRERDNPNLRRLHSGQCKVSEPDVEDFIPDSTPYQVKFPDFMAFKSLPVAENDLPSVLMKGGHSSEITDLTDGESLYAVLETRKVGRLAIKGWLVHAYLRVYADFMFGKINPIIVNAASPDLFGIHTLLIDAVSHKMEVTERRNTVIHLPKAVDVATDWKLVSRLSKICMSRFSRQDDETLSVIYDLGASPRKAGPIFLPEVRFRVLGHDFTFTNQIFASESGRLIKIVFSEK